MRKNQYDAIETLNREAETDYSAATSANEQARRDAEMQPRPPQLSMIDEELARAARGGQPRSQALAVPAPATSNIKPFIIAAAFAVAALVLYLVISSIVTFLGTKADDLQFGRPRTFQMDAFVGHDEAAGTPSHFIALNLNHQISVIELPGGDVTKARAISGPYLFGQDGDLTPVTLEARDLNADQRPDLLVNIKNEQVVYINGGSDFHLMTQDERAVIGAAAAGK